MKYITIILCLFSLLGCGAKRNFISGERMENPYISFVVPEGGWYVLQPTIWIKEGEMGDRYRIHLSNDLMNSNGFLVISIYTTIVYNTDFLNPDFNFEEMYLNKKNDPKTLKNHKEQRIKLYEQKTQYFQGMKCVGGVFSRNYGGSLYSASSKNYNLSCSYYDTNSNPRQLWINYRYYGANGGDLLTKDNHVSQNGQHVLNHAETILKRDAFKLIKSIELKNVDWDRMKKIGLIYNKPFEMLEL